MLDPNKPFDLIPWPLEDSKMELEEPIEMIVVKHQEDEAQVDTANVNSEFGKRSKTLPIYYKFMESSEHFRRFSI